MKCIHGAPSLSKTLAKFLLCTNTWTNSTLELSLAVFNMLPKIIMPQYIQAMRRIAKIADWSPISTFSIHSIPFIYYRTLICPKITQLFSRNSFKVHHFFEIFWKDRVEKGHTKIKCRNFLKYISGKYYIILHFSEHSPVLNNILI